MIKVNEAVVSVECATDGGVGYRADGKRFLKAFNDSPRFRKAVENIQEDDGHIDQADRLSVFEDIAEALSSGKFTTDELVDKVNSETRWSGHFIKSSILRLEHYGALKEVETTRATVEFNNSDYGDDICCKCSQ